MQIKVFNSTVWRLAPNHLHCGLKITEIAYLAAGVFNESYSFILRIMSMLDIIIDRQSKSYRWQRQATSNSAGASQLIEDKRNSWSPSRTTFNGKRVLRGSWRTVIWSWNRILISKSMKSYSSYLSNFERVFLKTSFSKLVYKIAKKLFNRSSSNCSYN